MLNLLWSLFKFVFVVTATLAISQLEVGGEKIGDRFGRLVTKDKLAEVSEPISTRLSSLFKGTDTREAGHSKRKPTGEPDNKDRGELKQFLETLRKN